MQKPAWVVFALYLGGALAFSAPTLPSKQKPRLDGTDISKEPLPTLQLLQKDIDELGLESHVREHISYHQDEAYDDGPTHSFKQRKSNVCARTKAKLAKLGSMPAPQLLDQSHAL